MLNTKSVLLFLAIVGLLLASIFSCNLKEYPPCVLNAKFSVSVLDSNRVVLTPDSIDNNLEYTWVVDDKRVVDKIFDYIIMNLTNS